MRASKRTTRFPWPLLALPLASLSLSSFAQPNANRALPAVQVSKPPVIDGVLDDDCWKTLPHDSGFTDATLGTPAPDDTIVWIGYDAQNIYVAFYCHDSDPSSIVAIETKRGAGFRGEDRVRFRINPFNSRRGDDESELNVNPLGTQYSQIAGGHTSQAEWAGEWQSAAKIVKDGWTAEIAVPWKTFTRPPGNGRPATLGINFERYQARTDVRSYWSNLGRQERRELGGTWNGVQMPPTERVNPLSILAYTYGGYDGQKGVRKGGLDARYQFSPLLTGVATLYPDLSNVEGAVTSIDFSYAEQLPSETRPFFLEGGGYYGWGVRDINPFVSVRIPEFTTGGKFYGRIGESTDVGLLSTENLGKRNDSVVYLKQTLSPYDVIQFEGVSTSEEGISNQVVAGKAKLQRGDWTAQLGLTRSFDKLAQGSAGVASMNWAKGSWWAQSTLTSIGANYTARDGYVPFVDEKGADVSTGFRNQWRTGRIRDFGWSVDGFNYTRMDGAFFRRGLSAHADFRTDKQLSIWGGASAGEYEGNQDRVFDLGFRFPSLDKYRNYGASISYGRLGGYPYAAFRPGINWRFFDRLSVGLSSEIIRLDGTHRQDVLSLAYDITPAVGIGGRLVHRDGHTNAYLSFRRSGYGGTEAYLIAGDPNADTFRSRLVFKIVRPL